MYEQVGKGKNSTKISVQDIGKLVRSKRTNDKLTLQDVAEQTGVSAATISRLERQHTGSKFFTPERSTVESLVKWLGLSLNTVGDEIEIQVPLLSTDNYEEQVTTTQQMDFPERVAVNLRADPKLTSKNAELLANVFRQMYNQFASDDDEDE